MAPAESSWKRRLRRLALVPAQLWVLIFYYPVWRLQSLAMPRDLAFSHVSQGLAGVPGLRGKLLRLCFYRLSLRACGAWVSFGYGTILSDPETEIGNNVYIGAYCSLGLVAIGDDTLLGNSVDIPSGKARHNFDRLDIPIRHQGGARDRVRIGRDAWIGNSALVLADVADQAIVGAGSVVTRPVAARAIAVGVPARVRRSRGQQAPGTRHAESGEPSRDPSQEPLTRRA